MSTGALVPTLEQIETLRDLFFKKLEREGTPFEDGFDRRDIHRIRTNNRYLHVLLESSDLDMKQTLKVLWDICVWRKSFRTNDITEQSILQEELYAGKVFPHNRDVDGNKLLIFKTKMHQKGRIDVDEVLRVVLYWMERHEREENYEKLSPVFDMTACGLSHLDMEFTKKIIDAFKLYYPYLLNYIIIYDMPWVLTAAFKIIKGLLPPKAAAKMKFVNQKNIGEYIDKDNALTCWGGNDDYTFKFVPEVRKPETNYVNHNNNNCDPAMADANDLNSSAARKVHFANASPLDSPMAEQISSSGKAELLSISPSDAIVFTRSGNEYVGTVGILNISEGNVTYKIKTTSPEKFRVRPSSGCLSSGSDTRINVVLQQGQSLSTIHKDKFLVMSLALTPDMGTSTQAIADLWKNTPANSPNVELCRLKCVLEEDAGMTSGTGDGLMNGRLSTHGYKSAVDGDRQMCAMLSQLTDTTTRLEKQLKFSQTLQWITISVFFLLFIIAIYTLKQDIHQSGICESHHTEL